MSDPLLHDEVCKMLKHWKYKAVELISKQESQKLYMQINFESFKKVLHLF